MFLAPGGLTARIFGRGTGLVFAIFARVTGIDMFSELSRFFRSLTGVLDGFGERTRSVAKLLGDPATTFLIVTSAEREPAREAVFLAERLADGGDAPRGADRQSRAQRRPRRAFARTRSSRPSEPELGGSLARRLAANLADFDVLCRRDRETIAGLSRALGEREPVLVPHLDHEIQDLLGLSRIAEELFS